MSSLYIILMWHYYIPIFCSLYVIITHHPYMLLFVITPNHQYVTFIHPYTSSLHVITKHLSFVVLCHHHISFLCLLYSSTLVIYISILFVTTPHPYVVFIHHSTSFLYAITLNTILIQSSSSSLHIILICHHYISSLCHYYTSTLCIFIPSLHVRHGVSLYNHYISFLTYLFVIAHYISIMMMMWSLHIHHIHHGVRLYRINALDPNVSLPK